MSCFHDDYRVTVTDAADKRQTLLHAEGEGVLLVNTLLQARFIW